MQIEFQNTKKDYSDLFNVIVKDSLKRGFKTIVIGSFLVAGSVLGKDFNWIKALIALISFPAFLVAFFYLLFYVKLFFGLYKKTVISNKSLTTTDDGINIHYVDTDTTALLNWATITSVHTNKKMVYLVLSDKSYLFIPKRFFISQSEAQFLEILENRFSKAKAW